MVDSLVLPTKPRNKIEELLLEEVVIDPCLEKAELGRRVIGYIGDHFSLVVWHHFPATITRYSFEETILAQSTYNSYDRNRPIPRIIGIQTSSDLQATYNKQIPN